MAPVFEIHRLMESQEFLVTVRVGQNPPRGVKVPYREMERLFDHSGVDREKWAKIAFELCVPLLDLFTFLANVQVAEENRRRMQRQFTRIETDAEKAERERREQEAKWQAEAEAEVDAICTALR